MKKKIAVLHAQIPFTRGGAELMVEALVNELRKRDFNAELVSIPFRWYPENGLYDSMLMWRMLDLREINGEPIDMVIPTKFPTYGINHPNKVLWLMHQHRAAYDLYDNKEHFGFGTIENGERMAGKVKAFDKLALGESKAIYTISDNVGERLKQNNGLESKTLYHPPLLAGRYYCEKDEGYILSVGRLDPLKRVDLLIESMKYCSKTVRLKIAGRGPELDNLKRIVETNNLEDRIEFLGYVSDEDLLALYANAKAIYFAPIDEDYGYITLEAFLSKKPVVTCNDSGGVLEFVKNEVSGMVCEPKPESIANKINALYDNAGVGAELGMNGYAIAKDISWDIVIEALTKHL